MTQALREFEARISDIEADFSFVVLATKLRPRLGEVVNWQAPGESTMLAQQFIRMREARIEGVLGPLLVRLLGSFERYLRSVVAEAIINRSVEAKSIEEIPGTIQVRNTILTGRLLIKVKEPPANIHLDASSLVRNLAACLCSSEGFQLNGAAFAAVVTGVSAVVVERSLENIGIFEVWDALGADPDIAEQLQAKGARETGKRMKRRLDELARWRNSLAHGGDDEVTLSEEQFRESVRFCLQLGRVLDGVVARDAGRIAA